MADVSGLYTALSGLYAARRGLDVSGQNIANVNTAGYTRQRVVQESVGSPVVPAIWSQMVNATGSGTKVSDVTRLRDAFLEMRGQNSHAQVADLTTQQTALSQVEQLFSEPSDSGLQSLLASFWNGFDDVANNPGDTAARAQLLQQATTVTDWLNQTATQMESQRASIRQDLGALVEEVNAAALSLSELNTAILRGQQADLPVNELLDQRDLLGMKLAELLGGTTRVDGDGTMGVYVSGATIVRGAQYQTMQLSIPDAVGYVELQWTRDSSQVVPTSGQAAAMLQANNVDIPRWLHGVEPPVTVPPTTKTVLGLDDVARAIAAQVNALHVSDPGDPAAIPPVDARRTYDLDGAEGAAFFVTDAFLRDNTNTDQVTALNIRVGLRTSFAIDPDPRKVAASLVAPTEVDPGPPPVTRPSLDGGNASELGRLADLPEGPNSTYETVIVSLGIAKQTVDRRVSTQQSIMVQIDDAREADAGVSLDEEMTNLLSYQRAYEAASRVMTSVDSMLDVLINRTGLVGR